MVTLFKKLPSWARWRSLPRVLNKQERILLPVLISLFILSAGGLILYYYFANSIILPAYGGQYKEGLIGAPEYINPLYSEASETDKSLGILIFSGLMKYDNNGLIVNNIAEKYEIQDNGKSYIFFLRKDVYWHDEKQLTAEDVIFTFNAFQNPEYKSPLYANWRGVKIDKIDDFTVKFSLNNTFAPFLENLTIGILPKHIWNNIPPSSAKDSEYNLKPIGSGPYKIFNIKKDIGKSGSINEIELKSNQSHHIKKPFIDTIVLKFFNSEKEIIKAFNAGEIDGVPNISPQNKEELSQARNPIIRKLKIPRYFAVFFNTSKSKVLSEKNVRISLANATNKKQIVDDILLGEADIIDAPILKEILGIENFTKTYEFSIEKARKGLSEWKDSNSNGILDKKILKTDKEPTDLEITLHTSDWPELSKTAELLKKQWEEIGGIKVNISAKNIDELSETVIRPREFDALLFGEILYMDPDPFSFWHSSQKKDPGLNLAMYENPEVDKLLEQARQTLDYKERIKKYDAFQQIIIDDIPAIFLFSPHYLYAMTSDIKGVEVKNIATAGRRFSNVENWYIKTKRGN